MDTTDITKSETTTGRKWASRADFEAEACMRIFASIVMKDSISHVEVAQAQAQALADSLQRRGFFGDPALVTEEVRKQGVARFAPQRRSPNSGREQMREAVEVVEQF